MLSRREGDLPVDSGLECLLGLSWTLAARCNLSIKTKAGQSVKSTTWRSSGEHLSDSCEQLPLTPRRGTGAGATVAQWRSLVKEREASISEAELDPKQRAASLHTTRSLMHAVTDGFLAPSPLMLRGKYVPRELIGTPVDVQGGGGGWTSRSPP